MQYPAAPRVDVTEDIHGVPVRDPYRWLEDPDDKRTVAWEEAQADLFGRVRSTWRGLRDWRDALRRAHYFDVASVPRRRGRRVFLVKRRGGEDHPVLVVREDCPSLAASRPRSCPGLDCPHERVLVDPLVIDPSGDTVLETWQPSLEGGRVAYQVSTGGTEDCTLRVLDVTTGMHVGAPIGRVRRSSIAWLPGGEAFYFVRRLPAEVTGEETTYHRRVYLHRVGSDPATDSLIFGGGRSPTDFYAVNVTADGRWLTISVTSGTDPNNELWLADLRAYPAERAELRRLDDDSSAMGNPRIIPGTGPRDPIWIHTDLDAPRGRVVVATAQNSSSWSWRTLIAERSDAVLEDFLPLMGSGTSLSRAGLVLWNRHAISELTLHSLDSGDELAKVPLPGAGCVAALSTSPDHRDEAWFVYTDHTHPPQVIRFDVENETIAPWFTGGTNPADPAVMAARNIAFISSDHTPVRMFVLSPGPIGDRPDRPRAAILTGYGGFGQSMRPTYLPQALAWVESGGVFAVACLRGGGEEGRQWHRAGMGVNKQRAIDDLQEAADYLIAQGWTTPERLGVLGQSNGGLVVSAAVVQRPEKYAAAACLAPLTDMIRYERSGMGPSWRPEYGGVRDPEQFRALLAYSPYHRVEPGKRYPAFLLAAFDADSRVDPAHARKLAAALQHASCGQGPVVYRLERAAGHGTRATSRTIGSLSEVLAFFGHQLDLAPADDP